MSGEYLIAMKLMSGRKYKNDLSDIVGILREPQLRDTPIYFEQIHDAVNKLYGGWAGIPSDSKTFIHAVMENHDWNSLYESYQREEQSGKEILIEFEKDYSNVLSHKKDKLKFTSCISSPNMIISICCD